MSPRKKEVAARGVRLLREALRKSPPAGMDAPGVIVFFESHGEQIREFLLAQLDAQAAQAAPEGSLLPAYEVLLQAIPNPDFGPSRAEAQVEIPRRWARVRSLAEARDRVRAFITENNLGGGNWSGGHVRQSGRFIARVSYNGRLWQTDEAGRQTGYELSPEGAVLDYSSAVDETKPACGCQHGGAAAALPPAPAKRARTNRRKG